MKATEAIYARRSVREFTKEVVSETIIRQLLEAATQAPSAMNVQPWAFVVVQDPELLQEISELANTLQSKDPLHKPDVAAGRNIFYDATTLIVICARPEGSHPDWDCCLAAENLLVAARDRGVGACTIGSAWAALNHRAIKRRLQIPESYVVVMPIIVGYPTEFPPNPGRNPAEILSWKLPAEVVG